MTNFVSGVDIFSFLFDMRLREKPEVTIIDRDTLDAHTRSDKETRTDFPEVTRTLYRDNVFCECCCSISKFCTAQTV